ncbi:hypothetical protein F2P56_026820 [Juglans regia]|uniref:Disease resistance-like protein DSC1 n=1 Tax=Juglans regia TaxID=51240 RepID=A0A833T2U1_JUGRE|nr:hypothetical protein F2P56_026820 [Juglans regia]
MEGVDDLTGAPNLEKLYLSGCRSLCEVHPSIRILKRLKLLDLSHCESLERLPDKFYLKSLEYLVLDECSSLEKLPDQSRLECLKYLIAYGIAITQIPSVNLFHKSIDGVSLKGGKWMPSNSRDPTYDIKSLVEYQMEGKYEVKAMYIDIDREGENILDMASGGVANSFYPDAMIYGWSLGSGIPKWVDNTSNGSSVKIDLDSNIKTMGVCFLYCCDFHQFLSPKGTSISSLSRRFLL